MGGEIRKGCTVLLGNPDKKYDYCITLPRTFVHDCSYPSQPSLQCRLILGWQNLVRVRNIVVAAILDFMTVEDWGE